MNNGGRNAVPKYRPDERKSLRRPLRRQLDEEEKGLLRPNS